MKIEYQRNLPHFQHLGYAFFVTWRLYGSLPKEVVFRLKQDREVQIAQIRAKNQPLPEAEIEIYFAERAYFQQLDKLLDQAVYGPQWLKQPEIARLVAAKLEEFHGAFYHLGAYCIMSNHVHALLDFSVQMPEDSLIPVGQGYQQLYQVMKRIKGGTAVTANRLLRRSGHFWAEETYDRYIRNWKHWLAAVQYIKMNPVKAGLCLYWENYPFTRVFSGNPEFIPGKP